MVSPRAIVSAMRTGIYGTVVAIFSINDPHTLQVLDAAIIGCVLADYATWLTYSLIAFPAELWHGAYDAIINTLFGIFMFSRLHLAFNLDIIDSLPIGFIAFLVMLLIKIIFYAGDYLREQEEDGM